MSSLVNTSTTNLSSTSNSSAAPGATLVSTLFTWLSLVYFPMASYYLPLTLVLGLLTNSLVLAVMFGSSAFRERTSKTARLYYIAIAIADICCALDAPLPWFLGTQTHEQTEYDNAYFNKEYVDYCW